MRWTELTGSIINIGLYYLFLVVVVGGNSSSRTLESLLPLFAVLALTGVTHCNLCHVSRMYMICTTIGGFELEV